MRAPALVEMTGADAQERFTYTRKTHPNWLSSCCSLAFRPLLGDNAVLSDIATFFGGL